MPVYNSSTTKKPVSNQGYGLTVWNDELVDVGSASLQMALNRDPNLPSTLSVELEFSGDPGAFQVDVECADTDAEKFYVTKATLSSGLNDDFVGRIEVIAVVAKLVRLKLVSRANSVNLTARIN